LGFSRFSMRNLIMSTFSISYQERRRGFPSSQSSSSGSQAQSSSSQSSEFRSESPSLGSLFSVSQMSLSQNSSSSLPENVVFLPKSALESPLRQTPPLKTLQDTDAMGNTIFHHVCMETENWPLDLNQLYDFLSKILKCLNQGGEFHLENHNGETPYRLLCKAVIRHYPKDLIPDKSLLFQMGILAKHVQLVHYTLKHDMSPPKISEKEHLSPKYFSPSGESKLGHEKKENTNNIPIIENYLNKPPLQPKDFVTTRRLLDPSYRNNSNTNKHETEERGNKSQQNFSFFSSTKDSEYWLRKTQNLLSDGIKEAEIMMGKAVDELGKVTPFTRIIGVRREESLS
jgi:hypothetical protein